VVLEVKRHDSICLRAYCFAKCLSLGTTGKEILLELMKAALHDDVVEFLNTVPTESSQIRNEFLKVIEP
jgi:hypothetical protein